MEVYETGYVREPANANAFRLSGVAGDDDVRIIYDDTLNPPQQLTSSVPRESWTESNSFTIIPDETTPADWDTPTIIDPRRQRRETNNSTPEIIRGYIVKAINYEQEMRIYHTLPQGPKKDATVIGQALHMYDVYTQDPWKEPPMSEAQKLQKLLEHYGKDAKERGRSPVILVAMDGAKVLGVATASKIPDGQGYSQILNPVHPQNIQIFEKQMRELQGQFNMHDIIYVHDLYVNDHRGGNVAIDLIKSLAVYARSVGAHDVLMRTVRSKPRENLRDSQRASQKGDAPGLKSLNPRLAIIAQAIGFEEVICFGEYPYNRDVLYGLWRSTVPNVESRLIDIATRGPRAVLLSMMRNERNQKIH